MSEPEMTDEELDDLMAALDLALIEHLAATTDVEAALRDVLIRAGVADPDAVIAQSRPAATSAETKIQP